MLFLTVVKLLDRKQTMGEKKGKREERECIIRPLPTALIDAEPSRLPHHPLDSLHHWQRKGIWGKLGLRLFPPQWQFLIGGLLNLVIESMLPSSSSLILFDSLFPT